jgi:type I restriction enzyme S subunit
MDEMTGISQFPYPVEALLAVGPYAIQINRETLETVSAGHQQRVFVPNRNSAKVPTNTFFDPKYAAISAVLGITLREVAILGRPHRNVLVYNPLATNPLPHKLLTSQEHWVCDVKPDSYTIHRPDDEPVRGDLIPPVQS